MKIIGLTGPTGSGKTTVSLLAEELGFAVIDCDRLARRVTERGSAVLRMLAESFGKEIILPDGTLDRKALAARAFSSPESTQALNGIMLPAVARLVESEIDKLEADGIKRVLLDAPTLFESGLDKKCDAVIAVLCPESIRKKRIIERDRLTEEQADTRLSASKPDEFYRDRTAFAVVNDGDISHFKASVYHLFNLLGE